MGLVVMAIIGSVVGGLTYAVTQAYDSQTELASNLHRGRMLQARLERTIRSAQLLCGHRGGVLCLWTEGENYPDQLINASELTFLRWDEDSGELIERRIDLSGAPWFLLMFYSGTVDLDMAHRHPHVLDFLVRNHAYCHEVVIAEDVTGLSVDAEPDLPRAEKLEIVVQLGEGASQVRLEMLLKLRGPLTDRVENDDGRYSLVDPADIYVWDGGTALPAGTPSE